MQTVNKKRRISLFAIDFSCFVAAYTAAELVAVIFGKGSFSAGHYFTCLSILSALVFGMRFVTGVYKNVWRYANSRAFLSMVLADVVAGLLAVGVFELIDINRSLLYSLCQVFIITASFDIITLFLRFVYQSFFGGICRVSRDNNKIEVAIAGAGKTGVFLAQELMASRHAHYMPVCFVDIDSEKVGNRILGLPVYSEKEIAEKLKNLPVQEIFIARPNITAAEAMRLSDLYSATGCKVKIYDFPMNDVDASARGGKKVIREIKIEDLLFRKTVSVADSETGAFYRGKTVMVTGCGSIGSELCRQIAACSPKKLVIVDIYENNAYDIQQELILKYGSSLDLAVEIASVRDVCRMEAVFALYRPQIVFHAAAHKHVPLMEHSSCEAVKNNVFGTYNTAELAEKYGAEKFILISTDKAVNPTNVMGATKRLCEMIVQSRTDSKTTFSAVRFGNVLGSNGSVIPLFRSQIEAGGPVTITDKRIIRYFMTIPEASQLVMQTGAMAKRGELFVLNMGEPVRILDLAESLIRLSGLKPYEDIEIKEIGLRPGEKLYEELLIAGEDMIKTDSDRIFIERDKPISRETVCEKLGILKNALESVCGTADQAPVVDALKKVVPTYRDPETVNNSAAAERELASHCGANNEPTEENAG